MQQQGVIGVMERWPALSTWFAAGRAHQPTAPACLVAVVAISLLVLTFLAYTDRHLSEDQCGAGRGGSTAQCRICPRCLGGYDQNPERRSGMLRNGEDVVLEMAVVAELGGTAAPWHGSNTLNTTWAWMT